MADDVRIATGLRHHRKTKRLKRLLGRDSCWSLVCLFLWVGEERWDGDLSGLEDSDLEEEADWDGEPGQLIAALVEVGFIDGEAGDRRIHDWVEHNPYAASKGARIAKGKRAAHARWGKSDAPSMPQASSEHATSMPQASSEHATSMPAAMLGDATPPIEQCPPAPAPAPAPAPTEKLPARARSKTFARSDSANRSTPAVDPADLVCTMPLIDDTEFPITRQHMAIWVPAYPAVDIRQQLRRAKAWLVSNPKNRKTSRGILRFVNTWMSKEQDRAIPIAQGESRERVSRTAEALLALDAIRRKPRLAGRGDR